MADVIQRSLADLRNGKFIFVFDAEGREGETDFMALASKATPRHIREMRVRGGGLIFLIVHHDAAERFGLPFLTSLYDSGRRDFPVLGALVPDDIPYDTKSSFSLSLNHRRTFTGITDNDRALTVRRFGELAGEAMKNPRKDWVKALGAEFRSPGHVPVCRSSPHPLRDRFGHTELGTALAMMAGETPVLVGCEMMGGNGQALARGKAKVYARARGSQFVEGKGVMEAWRKWSV
ncbi:MAG: 3,4-dihydroxy-2-butanone-4-phosphate synthase [Euryarchaeota archaeon]|nr:3,4-dihydroxy-2-butanone-4-phosphate synthase [Euryarchaeota archaeon]